MNKIFSKTNRYCFCPHWKSAQNFFLKNMSKCFAFKSWSLMSSLLVLKLIKNPVKVVEAIKIKLMTKKMN